MSTILLIHPSPLFRAGVRAILESTDMQIIGEAADAVQALEIARSQKPEMALLDASLSSGDPLELTDQLRLTAGCRTVIFTPYVYDEELLFEYMCRGAAAYVSLTCSGAQLKETMQRVATGEYLLSLFPPLVSRPTSSKELPAAPAKGPLTPTELEVLKQIMCGRNNREAARVLVCSDQTVKNHLTAILRKLNAYSRTHAVMIALERDLLFLEDVSANDLILSPSAFTARVWRRDRRAAS